jgi:hypothetical protein
MEPDRSDCYLEVMEVYFLAAMRVLQLETEM